MKVERWPAVYCIAVNTQLTHTPPHASPPAPPHTPAPPPAPPDAPLLNNVQN